MRIIGDEYAGCDLSQFELADSGSERSDRWGVGSVFYFVSAGAGADVVFRVCTLFAGVGGAGRVVRAQFSVGSADVFDGPYEGRYGGRGVLGAHWRICGGGSDGQVISGAKTTIAICLPLALFCSGDSRSASLVVSGAGRLFDR